MCAFMICIRCIGCIVVRKTFWFGAPASLEGRECISRWTCTINIRTHPGTKEIVWFRAQSQCINLHCVGKALVFFLHQWLLLSAGLLVLVNRFQHSIDQEVHVVTPKEKKKKFCIHLPVDFNTGSPVCMFIRVIIWAANYAAAGRCWHHKVGWKISVTLVLWC